MLDSPNLLPILSTWRAFEWAHYLFRYPTTIKVTRLRLNFFFVYVTIDTSWVERYVVPNHLIFRVRIAITPSNRFFLRIGRKTPILCDTLPFTKRAAWCPCEMIPIDIFLWQVEARRARGFQYSIRLPGTCQNSSDRTDDD